MLFFVMIFCHLVLSNSDTYKRNKTDNKQKCANNYSHYSYDLKLETAG